VSALTDQESLTAAIYEEVRLAPYDPSWPRMFEVERDRLRAALPGYFIDIQHIGSTAVHGMIAKPVIDIVAGVSSMSVADSLVDRICAAGYTTSAEFNAKLPDSRWFMRWSHAHRTHHLHVAVHGSDFWMQRLRFRDSLRTTPELARQYAELKSRLSEAHRSDREAYTDAKSDFIAAATSARKAE
jgi:GrpB-like predicted nucleotidyltransferase (UPF0157 family)